ncbi:EF-hand domain-containing protein [Roseovarius sp. EL26]|uniref:EF-hand domain-containing protein n=1 Tax=Roseovarius sp. EL26 TaxID=2126672 RepID=UPI000EA04EDA|nr:EF-hand domain-containing protein [Roseovarius sp. EL26]
MKKVLITTTAIFALSGPALAALSDVDTDGDGVVSFNELLAVYPTLTEEGFSAIDTNDDGVIDDAEMTAAQEAGIIPQG